MLEARESLNVRFALDGFDCQYTARTDQETNDLLAEFLEALHHLRKRGAVPTGRQPTTVTPNAQPPPDINGQPTPTDPPTCKTCGDNAHMELVTFRRNGDERAAWKCQHCGNWHWPNDKPKAKKGAKQ